MKIELGNFGYSRPEVVAPADKSQVSEALGSAGLRISAAEREAQQNREAMQRAQAANSFAKYQLDIEDVGRGVEEDMATGAVSWDKANDEFQSRVKKVPAPQVALDNPIDQENQRRGIGVAQERARQSLAPSIFQARQRSGLALVDSFMDTQAKRAIEPGANVDAINSSADAFAANARQYGIPQNVLDAKVQAFKDSNWYNSALQRVVESDGNLPALKGILADLTNSNGSYADKLDPPKRASLQAAVQNQIEHIELRAQAAGDRREARAATAIRQIDAQISSTIPATTEMWAQWGETVKGTSFEDEFKQMVDTEQAIQKVLRAPVADQKRIVQEAQTHMRQEGGTVAQANNVNRLSAAVDSNIKLLTQTPVLFGEQRLGDKNVPLNLADFATPAGRAAASDVLNERANRIRALGTQFQAKVQMAPLLPQEAKELSDTLNGTTPDRATALFGTLASVAKDPQVYRGMMQQIAPDSPVRAYAGQVFAHPVPITSEGRAAGPDQRIEQANTAATIVLGESLVNQTREQKGEDGKPVKSLYVPDRTAFDQAFADHVGDAFADRPDALALAQQVAYSYYVGKSAKAGRLNQQGEKISDNTMEEALHSAIGEVSNFHGYGHVILPLGMDQDQFQDAARQQFVAEVGGDRGVALDAFRSLGLRNLDGTRYIFTKGRDYFRLKGKPIVIDLAKPLPASATPAPLADQYVPM